MLVRKKVLKISKKLINHLSHISSNISLSSHTTFSLIFTSHLSFFFFSKIDHHSFPLFMRAIEHINHHENMIRIAAQTILLTIYQVEDERVRNMILGENIKIRVFHQIISLLHSYYSSILSQVTLDISNNKNNNKNEENCECIVSVSRLFTPFGDLEDLLLFLQDIFNLNILV